MSITSPIPLQHFTDGGISWRARIGLVVLQTDQTVEPELASLQVPGVGFHHARIENDMEVTTETLGAMEGRLPAAAALLPPQFDFAAIGYACTSAATVIGEQAVADAINKSHPGVPTTNPISAAIAAFGALGVERVGVVTPYSEQVTIPVINLFQAAGIDVSAFGSFLLEDDLTIARVTPDTVAEGLRTIDAAAECDAFFVSCTSVRSFAQVEALEHEFGRPIVSSNLALAWHLLRLAEIQDSIDHLGTLMRTR